MQWRKRTRGTQSVHSVYPYLSKARSGLIILKLKTSSQTGLNPLSVIVFVLNLAESYSEPKISTSKKGDTKPRPDFLKQQVMFTTGTKWLYGTY